MSVFSVPVTIGVDEEKITKEIESNVEAQVVNKITDEIKRQLDKTNAVRNDRIILIDENIMFRPGPRVPGAAKILTDKFIKARDKN